AVWRKELHGRVVLGLRVAAPRHPPRPSRGIPDVGAVPAQERTRPPHLQRLARAGRQNNDGITRKAPRAGRLALLPAAALACLLFSSGCREGTAAGEVTDGAGALIPAVEVTQARTGAVPLFERLTGTIRASGEVAIYPEAPGSIVEVVAAHGSTVQRGDVLVRIRTAGASAQIDQAE